MLEPVDPAGPDRAVVLRAHEESGGRRAGELELGIFSAALIIDRRGVLKELVETTAAVALGGPPSGSKLIGAGEASFAAGASGYRIDVVLSAGEPGEPRPACPYLTWMALASEDLVLPGGLFATIRSAAPSWAAGSHIIDSLRISGLAGAGAQPGARLSMPLVRGR